MPPPELIDLSDSGDDELIDDGDNLLEHYGEADVEDSNLLPRPQRSRRTVRVSTEGRLRAVPTTKVKWPLVTLESVPFKGISIKVSDTIELMTHDPERRFGDFLLVREIVENVSTGEINFHGLVLRRTRYFGGALPLKINEVCLMIQEDEGDARDPFIQGLVEVSSGEVVRVRNLVFSSKNFPADSFRDIWPAELAAQNRDAVLDGGRLVCRYVWTERFQSAMVQPKREKANAVQGSARRVRSSEHKGGKFTFGSPAELFKTGNPAEEYRARGTHAIKKPLYTYGTGCCGAGGDAEGARLAGCRVVMAWDYNYDACKSFELNHPRARVYHMDVAEFLQLENGFIPQVIIYHLSLPCDTFSPNHTIAGKNDEANQATFLAAEQLLLQAKPIYHTNENTFGLVQRHPLFFKKLLQMIMNAGYDVRWRVVNFDDYGAPASRQRLIIFAALRGYPLPQFPLPTHGLGNRRYVYDAIGNIPDGASFHLAHQVCFDIPKPPYNPRTELASCVTRDGGQHNYHHSGKRKFTPRELASLQTFRHNYEFHGGVTSVRTQIGNAVPPLVWKTFIEQILCTLEDFYDGIIDSLGQSVPHTASGSGGAPQRNLSAGNVRTADLTLPPKASERFPVRPSMSSAVSVAGGKRGGSAMGAIDRLSVRARQMSLEEDPQAQRDRKQVIIVEESDDDVVLVETSRKRPCKGKGKVTDVVDITE